MDAPIPGLLMRKSSFPVQPLQVVGYLWVGKQQALLVYVKGFVRIVNLCPACDQADLIVIPAAEGNRPGIFTGKIFESENIKMPDLAF